MSAFEHVDRARRELGWSVDGLWVAYAGLGGGVSLGDLSAFLHAGAAITARQYDYVAQALNDRFVELGRDHLIPYSETLDKAEFDAG